MPSTLLLKIVNVKESAEKLYSVNTRTLRIKVVPVQQFLKGGGGQFPRGVTLFCKLLTITDVVGGCVNAPTLQKYISDKL